LPKSTEHTWELGFYSAYQNKTCNITRRPPSECSSIETQETEKASNHTQHITTRTIHMNSTQTYSNPMSRAITKTQDCARQRRVADRSEFAFGASNCYQKDKERER